MPHYVRLMCHEDVVQVTEIDHEVFPEQLPPPNYNHELRNRLAHHIVACDEEKPLEPPEGQPDPTGLAAMIGRLLRRNRSSARELPPSQRHYIIGFVGFWVMADEAHITAVAVRETYRRQGVGELLLISSIGLATELGTRTVTLEVRASNAIAQSLYTKYGFTQVGVRRGYYIDNREDGIVMSTPDITLAAFQQRLEQLKQGHSRKYGVATYGVGRSRTI